MKFLTYIVITEDESTNEKQKHKPNILLYLWKMGCDILRSFYCESQATVHLVILE